MVARTRLLIAVLVFFLGVSAQAVSRQNYFRDLVVEQNENLETVVCFFCTIHVRGQAAVAVTLMGGVEISGTVSDTAVACGGGVRLLSGGKAQGTFVTLGGPVENAAGTVLPASVTAYPWIQIPGQRQFFWKGALGLLGLALLLVLLSYGVLRKRRVQNVAAAVAGRKLATLLTGLFALTVTLLVIIYAEDAGDWEDYLILGAPAAFFLLCLPGLSAVALHAGSMLKRNGVASAGTILGGAILMVLLMLLPVAGSIVCLLAMCLAGGGLILSRFGGKAPVARHIAATPAA